MIRFTTVLWRYPGPGGWFFVTVPPEHALPPTGAFRRTPVLARVAGHEWPTSVWHSPRLGMLLAVPKRVRGPRTEGAEVDVEIEIDASRI